MTKTIDYAYFRPNPADLVAAGVAGVCRYVAWGQGKNITKPEYDALRAAGISVMINWESTGKSWRNGYAMGVTEGREARRQARAVGHPDNRPIVQSMDEAVPAGMLNVAADYQRGFNDGGGCGPQGAYGTCLVLDHLFDLGLIVVGWQTNARGWEGNAKDCARASLLQRTTHSFPSLPSDYDESDVQHPDWGQHPFGPTPTPAPTPPKEDPMLYRVPNTDHAVAINQNGDINLLNGVVVTALHDYPGKQTKLGPFTVIPSQEGRYLYQGATATEEGTQFVLRQLFQHPDTGATLERIYVLK